jgi:hypothetical protein
MRKNQQCLFLKGEMEWKYILGYKVKHQLTVGGGEKRERETANAERTVMSL